MAGQPRDQWPQRMGCGESLCPSGPQLHCGRPPVSQASVQTKKGATSYHCLTAVLSAATTYILLRFPKRHCQEQGRDAYVPLDLHRQSRGPARSEGHTCDRGETAG